MAKIRIAINGFGRIGRSAFKIASENKNIEIAAINDLTDSTTLAHLLKYDTAYGVYDKEVRAEPGFLVVEKRPIPVLAEKDPSKLPWKDMKIDVVLECTGFFVKDGGSTMHLAAVAQR